MKNKIVFYLAIFIPIFTLILLSIAGIISSVVFGISMLLYALIYHPALSTTRLIELEVIKKEEFLKGFNPFWMRQHFNAVFF